VKIDLKGKTALVAGASRGIGRGIALGLARAGADLILLGRLSGELEQVRLEVESLGSKARLLNCDITQREPLETAFLSVTQLDILIVNAGTNIAEPFEQVSEAHFDRIFDLNVRAAFFVIQHALRKMKRGSAVVNISSQMGHVGAAHRSVYCASKHAIEGLTKALAVELAPKGIRVNSVAPTFIETDLTRPMLAEPKFKQSVLSKIPLGRLGQVDEVVNAVVFLASPAASLITGTSLLADGGWTAQ
jgi:NAD(P)-dependent dehydrogenase (short-subunit alcohol dehydrogenase family)